MRLLASLLLLSALGPAAAQAQCDCPGADTTIVGHRGAGADDGSEAFPENTIESARQAFTEGADMVEIDVQLTSDGAVVLMHDDTVDRTTDGTGCVSALSLAEIRALAAGSTTVPTLEELLAAVEGGVNVEVKLHEGASCPAQDLNALADAVVATIAADTASRRILVSSFDLDVLRRIRSTAPGIEIGYLSTSADDVDVAAAEGFEAIHLLSAVANARSIGRAHDAGLEVNVWTVDGADAIGRMIALDVDGVITDTAAEGVSARDAFCASYVCPGADAGAGSPDAGDGGGSDGGCAIRSGHARAPLAFLIALGLGLWVRRRR